MEREDILQEKLDEVVSVYTQFAVILLEGIATIGKIVLSFFKDKEEDE
jgi:hypothetical protein